MPEIFDLDDDTRDVIRAALDDIIEVLGKDCLLVYPARMNACANCVPSPMGGQSSNRWRTGGPIPFANGSVCPWCNGTGRRAEELTETIHLGCEWNPREFTRLFPNIDIRKPNSTLRTKGYLRDAPKMARCDHLRLQSPVEGLVVRKMQLASAPGDESSIIQGRYCVAYWHQIG